MRHEDYSDFGSNVSGSLSARYDFTPQVAGLLMYSTTLKYDGWSINKLAFLTPLLMKIPFGVHICRFEEKPPYGIKNERLRVGRPR